MKIIVQKMSKILIALLLMQIIFSMKTTSAASTKGFWESIVDSANSFLEEGKESASQGTIDVDQEDTMVIIKNPADKALRKTISDIYNVLLGLGVAITIIVGGILGINFMISTAEEKAKIKQSMVPFVIGCILIYGAFGIWKIVIMMFSNID